jgi:hypothetical protein
LNRINHCNRPVFRHTRDAQNAHYRWA